MLETVTKVASILFIMLVPGSAELTQSPSRGPGISGRRALLTVGMLSGLALTSVGTLMAFRSPAKATKENSKPAAATTAMLTKSAAVPTPIPAKIEVPVLAAPSAATGIPEPQPEDCMSDEEHKELGNSVHEVVKGLNAATMGRVLLNLPKERNVNPAELRKLIEQLPTDKQPHAQAMVLAVALYPNELPKLMQMLKDELEKQKMGFAKDSVPSDLKPADEKDMVMTARCYWASDPECDAELKAKLTNLIRDSIQVASLPSAK